MTVNLASNLSALISYPSANGGAMAAAGRKYRLRLADICGSICLLCNGCQYSLSVVRGIILY